MSPGHWKEAAADGIAGDVDHCLAVGVAQRQSLDCPRGVVPGALFQCGKRIRKWFERDDGASIPGRSERKSEKAPARADIEDDVDLAALHQLVAPPIESGEHRFVVRRTT